MLILAFEANSPVHCTPLRQLHLFAYVRALAEWDPPCVACFPNDISKAAASRNSPSHHPSFQAAVNEQRASHCVPVNRPGHRCLQVFCRISISGIDLYHKHSTWKIIDLAGGTVRCVQKLFVSMLYINQSGVLNFYHLVSF